LSLCSHPDCRAALIAAGISVAIIAVVNGLGTSLNAKFKSISTQLK
jgi:pilus assembly protein Flp/PilA